MQGFKRKIYYATFYEVFAVILTSLALIFLAKSNPTEAGVAGLSSSLVALLWNLVYNTIFEKWEAKQTTKGRSIKRRILHATGFEFGLIILLVPFFAWWLGVSLLTAFMLDLGIIIFFLIYTYIYNLIFDSIFGLPLSAKS